MNLDPLDLRAPGSHEGPRPSPMQDVGHASARVDPPSLVAQLPGAAAAKAPGQVRKLEGPQTQCSGGTDFRLALERGQAEESQQEGQGGSTRRTTTDLDAFERERWPLQIKRSEMRSRPEENDLKQRHRPSGRLCCDLFGSGSRA